MGAHARPTECSVQGVAGADAGLGNQNSPEPLYRQLATLLAAKIDNGTYTSRLPSYKTLTQEHDVSHVTAEKAVAVFKEQGRVVVVVGRGVFIKRRDV